MSSLLENIILRGQKINFDMSKSVHTNLLNERIDHVNTPIEPADSRWREVQIDKVTALEKVYSFNSTAHVVYFITEILNYGSKNRHYPVVNNYKNNVTVRLFTPDLNYVTEIDIEMSKYINEVYEDISFIRNI